MNAPRVSLPRVVDLPLPHYILPNGEGTGYGRFVLDPSSKAYFLERLPEVGDGLTRGTAWITLWDDMLEGGTPPHAMFDLALRALPLEPDEQNTQRILSYAQEIFWRFLSDAQRTSAADQFERTLRSGIEASKTTSLKAAYFNAFRASVTSKEGVSYLERVWRRQAPIEGLVFAETDYINMAQDLALRGVAATDAILADQHGQITNPDRKARFAFVQPALSPDARMRDAFFASLARVENRRQERWVADGLRFLNHPLRRQYAERYIQPGLALVLEVRETGDIFFPIDWTSGVLAGHNSPAAAATVTAFLQSQKDYPPRLRQIIEQVADPLIRASRIVK
jgi:aminopeptidase N